jgi:hypothetical protein
MFLSMEDEEHPYIGCHLIDDRPLLPATFMRAPLHEIGEIDLSHTSKFRRLFPQRFFNGGL